MTLVTQRSFSGGEISPSLYSRVDLTKYSTGLRTCKNFMILRHGGAANRPGSSFIAEVKDSTQQVRILPFEFNEDQTYVLEFGDQYMRVHKDGVQQTEAAQNITGVTQANPAVVTITAHGYSNGEEVFISGVVGMTELNNRNFKVANVTANTFELQEMDGTNLDSTSFSAYTSGGTAARVYEITTPYLEAELFDIHYTQSADVITLVHPNHAPQELSRTGDISWTLETITFQPDQTFPTAVTATAGPSGSDTFNYKVTAVNSETFEESLPGLGTVNNAITGITNANPGVVTATSHPFADGDEVYLENVVGMTEVNGQTFFVANSTANTFELEGVDTTDYGTYSSGGTATRNFVRLSSAGTPSAGSPHVISWTKADNAVEYNIYKEVNGVFGLIGIAVGTTFDDINITPATSETPPASRNPFLGTNNYPSTVTYIQQRLAFANTLNDPEKVFLSRAGNFKNFTTSSPSQSDDAITFTVPGRKVNRIENLVDLNRFAILTSGGEWAANGNEAGILTPTTINNKQYSYNGSGDLQPILVAGSALYQQARGKIIRDLSYQFEVDGYTGNDLTLFASHLFDDFTIVDWSYQQIPHSIVWVVRNDGALLGLTLVKEQQILAWHQHEFRGGKVKSVATVPNGNEDALHVIVERTIDGRTTKYVERFNTRQILDIDDAVFVDSALKFDGTNTNTSHTMTISGGTTWAFDETLTLTSSTAFFAASDIGNEIHLTGSDGTIIRFEIQSFSSSTVVTGKPNKTVPVSMRNVAISDWGKAVDAVSGLWHLEGENVSVFADGFVVASPDNDAYDLITVTNGRAVLDKPYVVINVGLAITADMETLDIDTPQGESLIDKNNNIQEVNLFVEETRGLFAGPKPPTGTDPLEDLVEFKIRNDEGYDEPVSLKTDKIDVRIKAEWNNNGRVFIRQVDPIPATILAVSPAGYVPFRG